MENPFKFTAADFSVNSMDENRDPKRILGSDSRTYVKKNADEVLYVCMTQGVKRLLFCYIKLDIILNLN